MADKEIEVNGEKYGEDTQITLKAKTLVWIIGLLIAGISTIATIGYFDIKSDVKKQKEIFEQEKETYIDDVKKELEEILKEDRDKREDMIETIGEMKGDIKMILDRTSRNSDHNSNGHLSPVNNELNIPTNNPSTNRNTANGSSVINFNSNN